MREIKPLVVPQNRWEFAGMWGGFGAGTEISKIASGSALSGGVKPGGAAGGAQVAGGGLADDARSFWSYGPLVIFAGGIVISILVKSLALPMGGAATEALYSLLRSQALQPGEGGVEEQRGGAGNHASSRRTHSEKVEVRVDASPARRSTASSEGEGFVGRITSEGSGGSGRRWPCTLDLLPESAPPSRLSGTASPRGAEGARGGDTDRSGTVTEQRV